MSNFNFEKSINELEELIYKMESNELSLDESIAYFERGSLLIKQCSKKLDEADKKVQILMKDNNNAEVIKDFEEETMPHSINNSEVDDPQLKNKNSLL